MVIMRKFYLVLTYKNNKLIDTFIDLVIEPNLLRTHKNKTLSVT